MSEQRRESAAPVEPYFDRTPQPFGDGPADPLVYDASPRTLRQRTVNFAAKRLVDMRYVSRLDRITAEQHFRWRPAVAPGGLAFRATPEGTKGSNPSLPPDLSRIISRYGWPAPPPADGRLPQEPPASARRSVG